MSKKGTKALASAALMSLVLTTALSAGPVKAASATISRTSGADRYATAAQVAKTNWTTTDNVVLVSGEGYADSVSASALAKKLDAPILLTTSDTLSSDAESAIKQLKPKNIYVIGGNASISQSIRNNLKTDYNLVELGGANRYETNVAVANKLVQLGVSASDVLVVGGEGFSDALSVAPVAAAKGQILLLANNNETSIKSVLSFVKDNSSKVTVVGTKNVINDAIYNALGASNRVDGGTDRFATNLNVLNKFSDSLKNDKLYVANASAATPDNLYADALVASALAGKYTAPLVLVDKDTSTATTNAENYIAGVYKNNSSINVNVIGGTGVISETLYTAISKAVGINKDDNHVTPEVNSINTIGLRQVKIVFSQEVDEDTAEDVTSYKVDGTTLTDGEDKAVLQDDNKTVLITLKDAKKQSDEVDVTVKKGILSADKASTILERTESVTFSDTTAPTLEKVDVRGNSKITVEFSEPVNVGSNESASGAYSKFKIDGKNLSSYGLDSTYTKAKDAVEDSAGNYWTNKIEFYFDTDIEAGNRTFKVSDGDKTALEDAAGFPVAETTEDINVDTLSTAPEITSITANDDGKVYINFDRPMDEKTAQDISYYEVNDKNSEVTNAELKKEDTQVKLTVKGLNKGSNKVYIDDNVEDAYGNNVEKDTYKPFELTENTTKPAVQSVTALDDTTIRVRFNKDVDASYGRNLSNYTLLDSDGTDVSSQMESIKVAGDTSSPSSTGSVFDISLGKDSDGQQYKLTDATYTMRIKYIQDTASTPNVMDSYEDTFDGSDEVNAKVEGVYKVKDKNKVTLVFNKEMDSSTLNDEGSYEYVNEKGETKTLPSSADASPSSDNKSVTIDLSDTSLVTDGSKSDEYNIKQLYATKVKDANGNSLQVGSQGGNITTTDTGAKVKANSLKVYYKNNNSDDLKVDVAFDIPIDNDGTVSASDFKLGGETPDYATADGKKVTLTFKSSSDDEKAKDATKINRVKAQGLNAKLEIVGTTTRDVTGNSLSLGDAEVTPYFYNAAPRTIVVKSGTANWTAAAGTNATVTIQFDTPIDVNSVKAGDFTFSMSGTNVDANHADVVLDSSGNPTGTVVFTFDTTESKKIVKGQTMTIKPAVLDANTTISTVKDKNKQFAYYKASSDDIKGIYVVVGEGSTTTVDKTDLNAQISAAKAKVEANYTAASWTAMQAKLTAAETVAANSSATQVQVDTAKSDLKTAIDALVPITNTGVELSDVTAINLGLSYMYEIAYGTVADSVASVKFYDSEGAVVNSTAVSLKDGKFTTEDETASIKVFDKDGNQIAYAKVNN